MINLSATELSICLLHGDCFFFADAPHLLEIVFAIHVLVKKVDACGTVAVTCSGVISFKCIKKI